MPYLILEQGDEWINDSVTVTDGTTKLDYALSGAEDTLSVSDFCDPVLTPGGGGDAEEVNPSDSVTPIADALAFDRGLVLADSVTPSDALALGRGLVQPDTVSLADAQAFDRGSLIADSVTPSDARAFDRANLIADTAGLSDNATTSVAFALAIDDTVGLADDSTAARGFTIEDSVSLSDGLETIDGNFQATLSD
jgi:hypothetical protein